MSFKPLNTKDDSTSYLKTLLYAIHGWGKTTQAKNYQAHYGKGFIISGEAGLSSIRSAGIDYLPFSSFDGPVAPDKGVFSFMAICRLMQSPEFVAAGYKWVMLDSLTELSDMVMSWASVKAEREAAEEGKKVNGFAKYGDYNDKMLGACKYIRDLPYHVIISALAQVQEDEDSGTESVVPLLQGKKIVAQVPGIFDNVLGGHLVTEKKKDAPAVTKRYLITGKYAGFEGKVRDENGVVQLVEETGNVVDVLKKITTGVPA